MKIPRKRVFWAVALGHTMNDIFMSMGPVILAFLNGTGMGISNVQIGLADGLRQMSGAVSQPFFGLRADRDGGRWIGALGVLWTVSMMSFGLLMVALTHSFWVFFPFYIFSALGSGAFHPVGAMHAADSDPEYTATNVSWFFMMGQIGLALGPFLAGRLLEAVTAQPAGDPLLDPLYLLRQNLATPSSVSVVLVLAPSVVPITYLMARNIPTLLSHRATKGDSASESDGNLRNLLTSIPTKAALLLLALVTLRSLATPGSVTFIPVLFEQKGWSPSEYGMIASSFWIASGVAGVYFGGLADRFDRRYVLAGSMICAAPAFFFLPATDGLLAFVLAISAGGLSGGAHSLIVVLAQELIPRGKGFASGAILGTLFGMGAFGSLLIGVMSDTIGLGSAFRLVAIAVTLAGLVSLLMPARENRPVPVPSAGD